MKKTGWTLFDEYMNIIDCLWYLIEPIIEKYSKPERDPDLDYKRKPGGGRKHNDLRQYINTILYVLCNGMQWNAVLEDKDHNIASGNSAHKWHMRWSRNGFYRELVTIITIFFDTVYGLQTKWCSLDGTLYKAPLAVEAVGKNPTDRGKNGTKRSLIVDEGGLPLGFFHEGANIHDSKLLRDTLINIFFPSLDKVEEKHLCLDAAYIGEECKKIAEEFGFIVHVQPRGDEKRKIINDPSFKARRWVVERSNEWFKLFRKLHTRYEKKH